MKTIGKEALFALLISLFLAPGWASAQWYVGASAGRTNNEWVSIGAPNDTDTSTYVKPFGGFSFSPHFAAEVGLANLGKVVNTSTDTIDARSLAFTLVGRVPVHPKVDFFGRWGLGIWNAKWSSFGSSATKTGVGQVVGLGFDFRISDRLTVGPEWEQYQNVGEGASVGAGRLMGQNIDTLGIRLVYHFDLAPGR